MRILLDYRPALRERTGVGEYVHEVARALVESAPTSESLTLFSSSLADRLSPAAVPGATVLDRRVPGKVLNFAWHRLEWPPIEQLAAEAFDVVQAAHPLLIPTAQGAQVVTIYDLDFLEHPERTHAEIRRDYPPLAEAHARRADHIVTISRHTAVEIGRRFQITADRITVCYPGAPAWTPRAAEPPGAALLFLGTLTARKNLHTLLDAYGQLLAQRPTVPPLILAGGTAEDSAPIVARATTAPFAGHVQLPGYIAAGERAALYQRALVFILPSHTEGFGMTAVEAMASGVPVIAADRGALPEVVGKAGLLVNPDDAGALAAAIARVLDDAGLRRAMSEAGLLQAATFTWRSAAEGVRNAWTRAQAARKRRRG